MKLESTFFDSTITIPVESFGDLRQRQIDGVTSPLFPGLAITESVDSGGHRVTHIPTGYALPHQLPLIPAINLAIGIGSFIDWNSYKKPEDVIAALSSEQKHAIRDFVRSVPIAFIWQRLEEEDSGNDS